MWLGREEENSGEAVGRRGRPNKKAIPKNNYSKKSQTWVASREEGREGRG